MSKVLGAYAENVFLVFQKSKQIRKFKQYNELQLSKSMYVFKVTFIFQVMTISLKSA